MGVDSEEILIASRIKARCEELTLHFGHFRDLIEIGLGNNSIPQTFHPQTDLDEIISLVQVNQKATITLLMD